jgi:hypothetical protein
MQLLYYFKQDVSQCKYMFLCMSEAQKNLHRLQVSTELATRTLLVIEGYSVGILAGLLTETSSIPAAIITLPTQHAKPFNTELSSQVFTKHRHQTAEPEQPWHHVICM